MLPALLQHAGVFWCRCHQAARPPRHCHPRPCRGHFPPSAAATAVAVAVVVAYHKRPERHSLCQQHRSDVLHCIPVSTSNEVTLHVPPTPSSLTTVTGRNAFTQSPQQRNPLRGDDGPLARIINGSSSNGGRTAAANDGGGGGGSGPVSPRSRRLSAAGLGPGLLGGGGGGGLLTDAGGGCLGRFSSPGGATAGHRASMPTLLPNLDRAGAGAGAGPRAQTYNGAASQPPFPSGLPQAGGRLQEEQVCACTTPAAGHVPACNCCRTA